MDKPRSLSDLIFRRAFLPMDEAIAPNAERPEFDLERLARLSGDVFIANSSPEASVTVTEDGMARVQTPRDIWAYSAHLLFREHPLPAGGPLMIRVELWVNRGAVGVGLLDADGAMVVQRLVTADDGRTAIDLHVPEGMEPSQIVIRNAGVRASRATLEGVEVYRVLSPQDSVVTDAPRSAPQPLRAAWPFGRKTARSTQPAPLVSLVLTVKNGMPYLKDAIESVYGQSYRNIELVVQDCLSTDGSSEFLAGITDLNVSLKREQDGGIGDANNRAFGRARGDIIGTIDADNLIAPGAVERVVEYFARRPEAAVVYGAVGMIGAAGEPAGDHRPGAFDFLRFASCDQGLPWSTAYFSRPVCGELLYLDPSLKTCVDFDIWLRLSHLPLAYIDNVLGLTRLSDASMSCRPDNYEQFCRDKLSALSRYVADCSHPALADALLRQGTVGVYCWAADTIASLAPDRMELAASFYERAQAADSASPRLSSTLARVRG